MDDAEETNYHRTVSAPVPACLTEGVHPTYRRSSAFIGGHFLVFLVIETVADNRLDQQVIRRLRHAHSDTQIEFPLFPEIDIHPWQELLLLIAHRVPAGNRAVGAVILQAERH